jgi:hypothetical protein
MIYFENLKIIGLKNCFLGGKKEKNAISMENYGGFLE